MSPRPIVLTFGALVVCAAGAALFAQVPGSAPLVPADPSTHRVTMVAVNGVRVSYLDWGGKGLGLVFIAGMGNSAHVFDDFAPRFVDRFRVLAVTRTGFGESDQPERDGYDLSSRVAHIREALDAAGIEKAALVGHSLGGDEITAFASTYPNRTAGLVYLDAAIDHALAIRTIDGLGRSLPSPPDPTASDRSSVSSYRQYLRRITGVEFPIGEVLATTVPNRSGLLSYRTGSRVSSAISAATVPPEFSKVRAPVLVLYSDATVDDAFPWVRDNAAERARAAMVLNEQIRPMLLMEREKFARAVTGAKISVYPAHHYQFLSVPDDTERRMRPFLSSLPSK